MSGNWTQATAGTNNFPAAFTGNTYFAPGDNASAELRQDINVAAFAATIASGTQLFAFNGWALSRQKTPVDNPQIIVEYRSLPTGNWHTHSTR